MFCVRAKRGKGTRPRVELLKRTPRNWFDFLKEEMKKQEFFHLLATQIACVSYEGDVVVTLEENFIYSFKDPRRCSFDDVRPCTQKEADTRKFLHAANVIA